jgi:hypothetical protein
VGSGRKLPIPLAGMSEILLLSCAHNQSSFEAKAAMGRASRQVENTSYKSEKPIFCKHFFFCERSDGLRKEIVE